jgi:integrase
MGRIRGERRLKVKEIEKLRPGVHEDGGGLRLVVEPSGSRRWVLRVTIAGTRRNRGLGPYPLVSLDKARDRAVDLRRAARDGRDLVLERRHEQAKATTFREAFETFFALKRKGLSNAKHLMQWPSTMATFVFPKIGNLPVAQVSHSDVLAVLEPIWYEKPETGRRVLQRLEAVFKSAILRGQREKASPCVGVSQELGTRHREVVHHRALPYAEVPAFMNALLVSPAQPMTKLAFGWLILTASRSGETRGARWHEINEREATWTIPRGRMKARDVHVVPLPRRCLAIAQQARALNPDSELLFPGRRTRQALSDMTFTKVLRDLGVGDRATAHGFRSSFRNWATEVAKSREVVAEAALAHSVRDRTEASYRRSTYLEERRKLMDEWARYCM